MDSGDEFKMAERPCVLSLVKSSEAMQRLAEAYTDWLCYPLLLQAHTPSEQDNECKINACPWYYP